MAKREGEIKNPTLRKVKNRGFLPVVYRFTSREKSLIVSGWIYKIGRLYLYFNSPSTGRRRLPLSEREHMREIA